MSAEGNTHQDGTEIDATSTDTGEPATEGKTRALGYDAMAVRYMSRARRMLSADGPESLPHVEHMLNVARVYAMLDLADAVRLAEESWSQQGAAANRP